MGQAEYRGLYCGEVVGLREDKKEALAKLCAEIDELVKNDGDEEALRKMLDAAVLSLLKEGRQA